MDPATPITPLLPTTTINRGVPRLEQPQPVDMKAAKLHKLEKASKDFEAIFLNQLLQPLAKSVSSSSEGSQLGGEIMMEVAMEKMAETLADKGGIGLGKLLMQNLKDRIIDDTVPNVAQKDTKVLPEDDQIKLRELPKEVSPIPMILKPEKVMPWHSDKSQTSQVR